MPIHPDDFDADQSRLPDAELHWQSLRAIQEQAELFDRTALFLRVLGRSALAGMCIGALQGFVGYLPRLSVILIAISAAAVGAVVSAFLGSLLYLVAFRSCPVMPALHAVALVAGALGVSASLFLRWWTVDQGELTSMFVIGMSDAPNRGAGGG